MSVCHYCHSLSLFEISFSKYQLFLGGGGGTFYTYSLMKRLRAKVLPNRTKSSKANHSRSYEVTNVKDTNIKI
jgi:hypothetical protein